MTMACRKAYGLPVEIPTLSDARGTGSALLADSRTSPGGRSALGAPLFPMSNQQMDICHCLHILVLKLRLLTMITIMLTLRKVSLSRRYIILFTATKTMSPGSLQVDGRPETTEEELIATRYGRGYAVKSRLSAQ